MIPDDYWAKRVWMLNPVLIFCLAIYEFMIKKKTKLSTCMYYIKTVPHWRRTQGRFLHLAAQPVLPSISPDVQAWQCSSHGLSLVNLKHIVQNCLSLVQITVHIENCYNLYNKITYGNLTLRNITELCFFIVLNPFRKTSI